MELAKNHEIYKLNELQHKYEVTEKIVNLEEDILDYENGLLKKINSYMDNFDDKGNIRKQPSSEILAFSFGKDFLVDKSEKSVYSKPKITLWNSLGEEYEEEDYFLSRHSSSKKRAQSNTSERPKTKTTSSGEKKRHGNTRGNFYILIISNSFK